MMMLRAAASGRRPAGRGRMSPSGTVPDLPSGRRTRTSSERSSRRASLLPMERRMLPSSAVKVVTAEATTASEADGSR